jgi:hypothetical protein
MLLYHHTGLSRIISILAEGITRGDVPLTPTTGIVAPWLTDDPSPEGHGLSGGEQIVLTPALRQQIKQSMRNSPGVQVRGVDIDTAHSLETEDKRAVRITVKIPRGDRRLVHWPKWARKRVDPDWYRILDEEGGGKSDRWWIFLGVIPPSWITRIENLRTGEEIPLAGPGEKNATATPAGITIRIPEDLHFSDLRLRWDEGGGVTYDGTPLDRIQEMSGLPRGLLDDDLNALHVIGAWYRIHLQRGGELHPIMEELHSGRPA